MASTASEVSGRPTRTSTQQSSKSKKRAFLSTLSLPAASVISAVCNGQFTGAKTIFLKLRMRLDWQAYFLGFETPVSFAPNLQDLSRRLNHQCLLTFLAKPEKKPGLQRVRVRTEVPNVELVAAPK